MIRMGVNKNSNKVLAHLKGEEVEADNSYYSLIGLTQLCLWY